MDHATLLRNARDAAVRTLREPVYQARPRYALLVFGPNAQIRVWIVLDGDLLFLDRAADGDLTGPKQRLGNPTDVEIMGGAARYVIQCLRFQPTEDWAGRWVSVVVIMNGASSWRQMGIAPMSDRPGEAPVLHFEGPLSVGVPTDMSDGELLPLPILHAGDRPAELTATVGTMERSHRCWVMVGSKAGGEDFLPPGINPTVEVEYPPNAPGGRPARRRHALGHRC